jgi:phospholipase C
MPSNCYPSDSGLYPADHNPAVYYTRIASECASWDVPSGTTSSGRLASDLAANTLPAFAFVVPNTCNSTETCAPATGDAWLQAWITKLVGSTAYRGGKTVIFVTWDEGNGGTAGEDCLATLKDTSCHVATVVLSPYTKPGTTSSALFSHYSLLSTTEQLLGLPSLRTASSSSTQTMRSAFHL